MSLWNVLSVCLIIVCIVAGDYILQIRKIYKIKRDQTANELIELYKTRERGERLLNVLEVMYVPVVLGMLGGSGINLFQDIIFFLAVAAIIVALNCRIYRYTIRIKQLEMYQQKMS